MAAPTLYYFPIRGRQHVSLVLAAYVEQEIDFQNPAWPAFKSETPLGQLPVLNDGGIEVAQSMAIFRYLARKWDMNGDTDEDYAMSEMLIEVYNDILAGIVKIAFTSNKKARDYTDMFAKSVPATLEKIGSLLKGDQFCSRVLAGDIAIFTGISLLLTLEPDCLKQFPELQAFHDRIAEKPSVKKYLDAAPPMTMTRPEKTKITIAYWTIRGLAAPLRMMMVYAGEEFENTMYDATGEPGNWDVSSWFDVKPPLKEKNPLMNLPYVLDGDKVITQSHACMAYVAHQLGLTAKDEVLDEQCCMQAMDLRNDLVQLFYSSKFDSEWEKVMSKTIPNHYGKFNGLLEKNGTDFLCGATPVTADFHLCELIDQVQTLAKQLGQQSPLEAAPALKAYFERFQALPAIQEYLRSSFHALPINNKMAAFGAKPTGSASEPAAATTATTATATAGAAEAEEDKDDGEDAGPIPDATEGEGVWLEKLGAYTGRKPRYFSFEGKQWVYYLRVVDGKPTTPKGSIKLSNTTKVSTQGPKILIDTGSRVWDLLAKSPELAAEWAGKVQAACKA